MAETALEVLSLADARAQLDILESETEQDSLIESAIISAVNYVMEMTGIPLIEKTLTWLTCPKDNQEPIILPYRDVKSIEHIKYWQPGQYKGEAPAGEIADLQSLGERREVQDVDEVGWVTQVWPSADGWPSERLSDLNGFRVEFKIGWEIPEQGHDIRHAIILIMRQFFEQPEDMSSMETVKMMLLPHARWNM